MCGLLGMVIGKQDRTRRELDQITDMFTRLLLLSEHRGPFATGVARIDATGDLDVLKHPMSARVFVGSRVYRNWVGDVSAQTTYLMGHTRWPTHGSIRNPDNNHPLVAPLESGGSVLVTHNGTLADVEQHFRRLGLRRTAQVDSELLLRLAQRHAGMRGLDFARFASDLEPLAGRMSLAVATTAKPNEIILLKGNMPLEVRLHRERGIIAYASESGILSHVLTDGVWEQWNLPSGQGIVASANDVPSARQFHFRFGKGNART